jgi:hypothetical protein
VRPFAGASTEQDFRVIVHRLTVDGRDYFLPDPVTELRSNVLAAIQAGGGYVNIPPLRGGPGIDILFSPGMPVVWSQIDVGGDSNGETVTSANGALEDDAFGL